MRLERLDALFRLIQQVFVPLDHPNVLLPMVAGAKQQAASYLGYSAVDGRVRNAMAASPRHRFRYHRRADVGNQGRRAYPAFLKQPCEGRFHCLAVCAFVMIGDFAGELAQRRVKAQRAALRRPAFIKL